MVFHIVGEYAVSFAWSNGGMYIPNIAHFTNKAMGLSQAGIVFMLLHVQMCPEQIDHSPSN